MRFRPTLGDYFPLDDEHVRTEYLKRKAARLATEPLNDHRRVIYREHLSTMTVKTFSVYGDSEPAPYTVCVLPGTDPWMAACSRGGVHDLQPPGACSHGVAAAAVWKLLSDDNYRWCPRNECFLAAACTAGPDGCEVHVTTEVTADV